MSDEPELLVETQDGVQTLTLNRPHRRNALSASLVCSLRDALGKAKVDEAVHVIVIKGAGGSFCAGGDLNPQQMSGGLQLHDTRTDFVELLDAFNTVGKPTVGQIEGRALGGGFGLALACDLAIATESAQLGTPEVRLGLFPMMIMPLIYRHMGRKQTLELILTGGKLTAQEAKDAGCLNKVVPDDTIEAEVQAMVETLRGFSPAVHKLGLQHFHRGENMSLSEGAALGADALGINMMLEDAAEGIMAFLSKRPPEWKGR